MERHSVTSSIALVTGASSGIGKELVNRLVYTGWIVIAIGRNELRLKALQDKYGEDCLISYVCDVTNKESVAEVSQDIKEKSLTPDLFFLNAGLVGSKVIEEIANIDISIYEKTMNTNYFGVLYWIQEWAEYCKKKEGTTFVVSSSLSAFFPPPRLSAYSASKSAISKAYEGLERSYLKTNIRFCRVFLGPVKTSSQINNFPFKWETEKVAKKILEKVLQGKKYIELSIFYSIIVRILYVLPSFLSNKIWKLLIK